MSKGYIAWKNWGCKTVLTIVLFLLCTFRLTDFGAPVILMDEFGYWSNAAYFLGLDWSGVAQFNNYYSYGYSFVQAAMMFLFRDPVVLYWAVIILNALVLCCSFWIASWFLQRLGNTNQWVALGTAFFVTCYPTNISNAHIAWPESWMVFLTWVSIACLMRYLEKRKLPWLLLWTVILLYSYTVHQRCLALVAAGVVALVVSTIAGKVPVKHLILFFVLLGGLYLASSELKGVLKESVLLGAINENANTNDYGSIFDYILKNLNLQGLFKLLLSIAGKVYYLLCSSFLFWGIGFLALLDTAIVTLKTCFRKQPVSSGLLCTVYLVGMAVFSIMISSIFTMDPSQIDIPVYGRYTEWCIAPIMAFGVTIVLHHKKFWKQILTQVLIFVALTGVVCGVYVVHGKNMVSFRWVCSAFMSFFYQCMPNKVNYVWFASGAVLLVVMVMGAILSQKRLVPKRYLRLTVISLGSVCFIAMGAYTLSRTLGSNYRWKDLTKQQSSIEAIDPTADIKFFNDHEQTLWYAASLQYLNRSNSVETLDLTAQPDDNYFLLCKAKSSDLEDVSGIKIQLFKNSLTEFYYIVTDETTLPAVEEAVGALYQQDVTLADMELAEGGQLQKLTKDGSWDTIYTATGEKDQKIPSVSEDATCSIVTPTVSSSVGDGQYVIYGPGITLSPGTYQVTFTLDCLSGADSSAEELGYCEVSSGNGKNVLATAPITTDLFAQGGSQTVTVEFSSSINASLSGVEFRLYVVPGVQFRVEDISYRCTSLKRQAILPTADDYGVLRQVLEFESEGLPVRIALDDSMLDLVSCTALQDAIADTGHTASIISLDDISTYDSSILLIPSDKLDVIFDQLDRYTILARLNDFALLVPMGSSVEGRVYGDGGRPLSEDGAINIRYFAGSGTASYGNISVNIPAGEYKLHYRLDTAGTPLWPTLGTLRIKAGMLNETIDLTTDSSYYGLYEGTYALSMISDGSLQVQLSTYSGITVGSLEVYLSRAS